MAGGVLPPAVNRAKGKARRWHRYSRVSREMLKITVMLAFRLWKQKICLYVFIEADAKEEYVAQLSNAFMGG